MKQTHDDFPDKPSSTLEEKIGIAITTHNRPALLKKALAEQQRFLPPGAVLCVIDDGSTPPAVVPKGVQLVRHEKAKGVPGAKNAGIRVLMAANCTHLFLFDEDAYPLCADWYRPYVESPEPHLTAIFTHWANGKPVGDCHIVGGDERHLWYSHERGYLIYLHRSAIEKVGGMDRIYQTGCEEHLDLSDRLYAAGLTSWRYMDVRDSDKLIYSADRFQAVSSSVFPADRTQLVARNLPIRLKRKEKEYARFAAYAHKRVVLTSWLTAQMDDARQIMQPPDATPLQPLADSVKGELVVFYDQPLQGDLQAEQIQVPIIPVGPYVRRWQLAYSYLLKHPAEEVWMVDATDVVRLIPPKIKPGKLYLGWEPFLTDCDWMKANFTHDCYRPLYQQPRQLLNCGVVGGDLETVKRFLRRMMDVLVLTGDPLDMGAANLVAYRDFAHNLITGIQVTTLFRFQQQDGISWWKHK
ncbi:MAG TPA: hypothetical protein DEP42_02280 [Ruminococcaceae bacterium]|nr:hypothetical protein [Oscillospiraceae bacterium]